MKNDIKAGMRTWAGGLLAAVLLLSAAGARAVTCGWTYDAWSPAACAAGARQTRVAVAVPQGCTGFPEQALGQACAGAVTAVNGVCGTSSGQTLTAAPTSGLCAAGTATAVSGAGPWTWSCLGTNGGTTGNCSAAKAVAAPSGQLVESGKEIQKYDLGVGMTDLYRANVTAPSIAMFVNATKDWSTRRDMLVMYGGAACDAAPPTVADHTAIWAGINAGTLPLRAETGVRVNNRTFYYSFEDLNNQGVTIGRLTQPAAPAGCYYALIYNVSTSPADYSFTFAATPK